MRELKGQSFGRPALMRAREVRDQLAKQMYATVFVADRLFAQR